MVGCSWVKATITEESSSKVEDNGDINANSNVNDGIDHSQQQNEDTSSPSSSSLRLSVEEIKTEISQCTNSDCIMHWAQLLEEKEKILTIVEDKTIGNSDESNEPEVGVESDAQSGEAMEELSRSEESNAIYIKDMVSLDTSMIEDPENSPQETDPLVGEVVQEHLDEMDSGPNRTVTTISPIISEKVEATDIPQEYTERDKEEEKAEDDQKNGSKVDDSAIESVEPTRLEENEDNSISNKEDSMESEIVSVAELSVDVILKESNIKDDEVHTFPDGQIMTSDGVVRPAPAEENVTTQDIVKESEQGSENMMNYSHGSNDSDSNEKVIKESEQGQTKEKEILSDSAGSVVKANETAEGENTPPPPPLPPKKELSAREIQARRSADGYLSMAAAYSEKQDYETALKQTAKAIKRDKNYPDIYVIQGKLHAATGKVNEAVDDFLKLFELSPANITAVKFLINIAGQVYIYKMHEMVIKCLLPIYETINDDFIGNITVYIEEENKKNMTRLYHDSEISLLLAASLLDQKNYSIALGVLQLNDLLNDRYMSESKPSNSNSTDIDEDLNESDKNSIAKARINLYIAVYEQLNMLDDAEMLLQKTIESSNGTDLTWVHLGDFNARQNRTEKAIIYYDKELKELEKKMVLYEQTEESVNDEETNNRNRPGSDVSASSSNIGNLKLQIALIHKKLGGVYAKVNITKALEHFDNAIDLGLLDAEIRKFYAGEDYRNATSITTFSLDDSSDEDADANDQTNDNSDMKKTHPSIPSHQIPRMNHRYRWLATPTGDVISRTMSNKGMKLRDTGAGSVREIEKSMPIVP